MLRRKAKLAVRSRGGERGDGGRGVASGAGAKGHGEGIENKWVRDSAIFRWCRVFRPGDSALSSALRFHRSSIPSALPRFHPSPVSPPASRPANSRPLWFRRGVPLVTPVPRPHAPSVHPESSVQQLGAIGPRESLVSGYALPLTASHRKPIETSRISPFGWTFAALCLSRARELLPLYTLLVVLLLFLLL